MKEILKYNVIYADPPWSYSNKNTGGSSLSGAFAKYPTMNLEQIKALAIPEIIQKDALLFLWATVPLLDHAFEVMTTWGFKYKTSLTWHKQRLGMGYWFRGQCEYLLLGVRGKVTPFRMQLPNFYSCKPLRHSEKPDYFRQLINAAVKKSFNHPVKLELFARIPLSGDDSVFEGWDLYGNEIAKSIALKH